METINEDLSPLQEFTSVISGERYIMSSTVLPKEDKTLTK